MVEHMRAEVVVDAIRMAATHNQLAGGAVFHSDRGSQYTSKVFRDVLTCLDLRASMGRDGSCFDNTVAEGWFATLKTEIGTTMWPTRDQGRANVFAFIQWYNRNRRHSTWATSPVKAGELHTTFVGVAVEPGPFASIRSARIARLFKPEFSRRSRSSSARSVSLRRP